VDYLEQDPRSEARLSEQQPPTVLAVDVTSDAADLELLKASLTQACGRLCAESVDSAPLLDMQALEHRCTDMAALCSHFAKRKCDMFCSRARLQSSCSCNVLR